ncbi:MAG: hypothetical protein IIZ25_09830 [Thermoguttaceae bacterium]|nr:hypothetical protein [Thermoguttaceae bacterium]
MKPLPIEENHSHISRRHLLAAGCAALAGGSLRADDNTQSGDQAAANGAAQADRVPLILHQTDLFRPHGDPDDHFDLATVFALALRGQAKIAGIVIDSPPPRRVGDPDVAAIAQMNRLCGLCVPAAVGSGPLMSSITDSMPQLDRTDCGAIELILSALRGAPGRLHITCVGSASDIAVAALRDPELFAGRCAAIHLDAGSAHDNPDRPEQLEFNVSLNPIAYASLFSSPAPICWYPCWDTTESWQCGPNGAFYKMSHRVALDGISKRLRNFFTFMLDRTESAKWLAALDADMDDRHWEEILTHNRGMWSTASILRAAGQTVTRDGDIVPEDAIDPNDTLYRMESIEVTCTSDGFTTWKHSEKKTNRQIFHILDLERYPLAMGHAVNTLLKEF